MSAQPVCAQCSKRYGKRWTTDEVVRRNSPDEPFPPHRGKEQVVREVTWNDSATTTYRTLWDGETWIKPHDPFCTLRCALAYARKAYHKGKWP